MLSEVLPGNMEVEILSQISTEPRQALTALDHNMLQVRTVEIEENNKGSEALGRG